MPKERLAKTFVKIIIERKRNYLTIKRKRIIFRTETDKVLFKSVLHKAEAVFNYEFNSA